MEYHPRLIPVEMSELRAKRYIFHLLSALDYLHANGCTHNDLKPSNILLSHSDKAVLCDFGFAQRYTSDPQPDANGEVKEPFMSTLSWGTPEYLSPERVKGKLHDERLSDLWSLGVTAYEVCAAASSFVLTLAHRELSLSLGEHLSRQMNMKNSWTNKLLKSTSAHFYPF